MQHSLGRLFRITQAKADVAAKRISWFSLSMDAASLGLEAQGVIGLRLRMALWGGEDIWDETWRMTSEKAVALVDAHCLLMRSMLAGEGHLAAAKAVALYRRRVRANRRRLTQDGRQ